MDTEKKKENKVVASMEKAMPVVKDMAKRASEAVVMASDAMVSLGEKIGGALPDMVPGLAHLAVIQMMYSLALAVLMMAMGSSGLGALIMSNLPLTVFVAAMIIKRRMK
jgi:hypothetical protein